jgi:hypothetical protein
MAKLFKKLPDAEKRTIRYEILLSQSEARDIRTFAQIRNLSVADFMRRASLGRRADVRYETETVLRLREIVQSIRQLHATYSSQGFPIPKDAWGTLMDEALAAMLRISK